MAEKLILRPLSSLAKVFPDEIYGEPFSGGSLLQNEEYSFQIAYTLEAAEHCKKELAVTVESALADCVSLRRVEVVPSLLATWNAGDGNLLRTAPGLFPDPLLPLSGPVEAVRNNWHGIWVTVRPDGRFPAGKYPVRLVFTGAESGIHESAEVTLEIIGASLPEQELIFTQWFHADCIASYYHADIFSERHWELLEKFMCTAAENGANMLLTPLFTPPLDTQVGGERPTVQLVEVTQAGNGWKFGFDRLHRWLEAGKRAGMRYFEMSHLFTQWGAEFAPKIVAQTPEGERRVFGWETDAGGEEYTAFLRAFLPELTAFLRREGAAERCWFHVSDEPPIEALETYRKRQALLKEYLDGFRMLDALSEPDYYDEGLVETPVAATDHIAPFLERNVHPLWAYYCCAQGVDVSNRFLCMPSQRNRVIAAQLYKFQIEGFLQWGYNFYYSQFSKSLIDPWRVTDAAEGFPSGDPFSVYPGGDGPVESLRLKVFHEALQDLRAFRLLERKIGRDAVLALIEEEGEITFTRYPREEGWLLKLREKVNRELSQ